MIRKLMLGCLLVILMAPIVTAQKSGHFGAQKYMPEGEGKLLIVGQDLTSVGGLPAYTNGYIDQIGHMPAGVTTYAGFPSLAGLNTKANWGAGDVHANAYSSSAKFENTSIVIGLHLVGQLKNIISGASDYPISVLGEWIKKQNRPVFLRIGYEFDGPWNNYNATDFKAAWIYMVHAFDAMDIRNVAYVWQSAGINTTNIAQWYPGDDYVNWMGFSYFDEPDPGKNILSFAAQHNKPVMIAEATPKRDLGVGDGETHWNAWFKKLFTTIHANDRIKALAYINADWDSQSMWQGQGWGDSRVQVNDVVKEYWLEEINQEQWIKSTTQLFDVMQYQLWQDSVYTITAVDEIHTYTDLSIDYHQGQLSVTSRSGQSIGQVEVFDFAGKRIIKASGPTVDIAYDRITNRAVIVKISLRDKIFIRKIFFSSAL